MNSYPKKLKNTIVDELTEKSTLQSIKHEKNDEKRLKLLISDYANDEEIINEINKEISGLRTSPHYKIAQQMVKDSMDIKYIADAIVSVLTKRNPQLQLQQLQQQYYQSQQQLQKQQSYQPQQQLQQQQSYQPQQQLQQQQYYQPQQQLQQQQYYQPQQQLQQQQYYQPQQVPIAYRALQPSAPSYYSANNNPIRDKNVLREHVKKIHKDIFKFIPHLKNNILIKDVYHILKTLNLLGNNKLNHITQLCSTSNTADIQIDQELRKELSNCENLGKGINTFSKQFCNYYNKSTNQDFIISDIIKFFKRVKDLYCRIPIYNIYEGKAGKRSKRKTRKLKTRKPKSRKRS